MFGDDESVFDRLWALIRERLGFDRFLGFIIPLQIIQRPESLTIFDYRPTIMMFLAGLTLAVLAVLSGILLYYSGPEISTGLVMLGLVAAPCLFFLFRGTIREVYYFDRTTDSYTFIRQFIHRREVIEGAMSQFTGAYVKTVADDESESYFVVLKQEGMFLTGVSEQNLREEVPMFNSFDREARIAGAVSGFLSSKN